MTITIRLTENALRYLRDKLKGRRGAGAYLSTLIAAEEAREQTRVLLREERVKAREEPETTKESWEKSGVNVD